MGNGFVSFWNLSVPFHRNCESIWLMRFSFFFVAFSRRELSFLLLVQMFFFFTSITFDECFESFLRNKKKATTNDNIFDASFFFSSVLISLCFFFRLSAYIVSVFLQNETLKMMTSVAFILIANWYAYIAIAHSPIFYYYYYIFFLHGNMKVMVPMEPIYLCFYLILFYFVLFFLLLLFSLLELLLSLCDKCVCRLGLQMKNKIKWTYNKRP